MFRGQREDRNQEEERGRHPDRNMSVNREEKKKGRRRKGKEGGVIYPNSSRNGKSCFQGRSFRSIYLANFSNFLTSKFYLFMSSFHVEIDRDRTIKRGRGRGIKYSPEKKKKERKQREE